MGKVATANRSLRVGLTGGIASGKTLVAALFEVCEAPVAFADTMARGLMELPGPIKEELVALLGADAYHADGSLDRPALGQRLFKDKALLAQVNAIVHPAVKQAALAWHERHAADAPYTLYESALLFESGAAKEFDLVVLVHAPHHLRLQRAVLRDGAHEQDILARMEAQFTDEARLAEQAYVILNDGSLSLIQQVYSLHQTLSRKAAAHV